MNAKNGTAFVTKFAPRRACIAPPRARSRECREVTRIQEQPRTSFPVARWAPEKAVSAQLARFVFFVFSSSAAFKRARAAAPLKAGRARGASRWKQSSRYAVCVRDVSRRDAVPTTGRPTRDPREKDLRRIFSAPPRVPTTRVADGAACGPPARVYRVSLGLESGQW